MNKAVYPGTFDPITRGHEDLVLRAASLFDHVVLAVADSPSKRPFFSLRERVQMAKDALAGHPNVEVLGFSGLLMDFLRGQGARIILRGLRAVSDFEYEFQMAANNKRIYPRIETVFLMASETSQFISSRFVKEIHNLGGDVSSFVTGAVLRMLDAKRGRTASDAT